MKFVREIIQEIITEIFDTIELPDGIEIIKSSQNLTIYKFVFNNIIYGVGFGKITNTDGMIINDNKIKDLISSLEKYSVNFGTLDKNNQISDDIETNEYKAIKIISFVGAIIREFIKNNKVDVISYFAKDTRDDVYKYIYKKYLKNDFFYYTAKESPFYDRIFIKKEFVQ